MAEESSVKLEFDNNGNRIGKVITSNVSDSVGRKLAESFGFHYKPERVIGRVENMRSDIGGLNVKCLCVPTGTPRHSGRYPWKDDDNDIREVFNMDSNRLNRFATLLNAVGGSFRIDQSTCERSMAHIDIPCDMLSYLHFDGDGSIGLLKKVIAPKLPDICNVQTFNDRAVQITFADGSQTKCVCGKGETFDLYEGIAFCLFKRFLGKEKGHKRFNDMMRYAFKKLDEQEKAKEREAKIKAENKRHEEKKKLQAERRKARKREEKIGIFVEALKRNRQALINEMPVYSVPEPAFKPDENPEKEG